MIILLSKKTLYFICVLFLFLGIAGGAFARISELRGRNISDVVWAVETEEKVISFTFDDGPDPIFTPQILEILKKNDVKCTFFTVGRQIVRFPEVAQKIAAEGHEIANHTYSHPYLDNIDLGQFKGELEKAHQTIVQYTQFQPTLFRPPGGFYNKEIIDIAKKEGYKIILWSWTQQTRDWANPGTEYIINKVLTNAKNGDIVIFHDCGGDRTQTVQALEPIITGLKEKGFQLVTVSELLTKGDNVQPITTIKLFE